MGGAAITEELRPGYWFTTFSYALSLLRPDIIHDLELTKHGFMPILMPTTFCPMENGDYLLLGQDHGENHHEIARHSRHDADAYDAFNHDVLKVCQAIKPLLDAAPPDIFSDDPEELIALAALGSRFRKLAEEGPPRRRPAPDRLGRRLPRRLLRVGHPQGLPGLLEHHRDEGRALLAGLGARAPVPPPRRARRRVRGVGLPQAAATAASPRSSPGRPSPSGRRSASSRRSRSVITSGGRATGVALADGREFQRPDRRLGARSATDVPRARGSPRAADRPRRDDHPLPLPGHVGQGQLRPRRAAPLPGPRRPRRIMYRGFTNIGPSMEYLERAFDDAKYGGLLEAPLPRLRDPVDGRPGHGAARQGGDELLRPVRARTTSGRATGTPSGSPSATPSRRRSSRSSRASAISSCSARSGTPLDIERTVGLSEGNIFAGEFLAPQMYFFRPAPGWSQYRTPIDGYYQCGSGTHPGGCVMGAPGKLAATRILKDRARDGHEATARA